MGQFPTNESFITRAQTWSPTPNINPLSAWFFENQSGTLGTNLNGSVVYVGTTGTVNVILAGVTGLQGVTAELTLASGGTGYTTAAGLPTTVTTTVPASSGAGLTVDITVVAGIVTAGVIGVGGTNYAVGDIITIVQAGSTAPATFTVTLITNSLPTATDAIEFVGVPAGTILPVVVDYILAPGANPASDLVIGK